MALVSAQYSDSEGEFSDDARRPDEDDEERRLPFEGGASGGSSGRNSPPPPPRGGRALSGSPDVIAPSLLSSRQHTPKSGSVDSPLVAGGLGVAKTHGISSLVGNYGPDEDDDDGVDEGGGEGRRRRRRTGVDEGLVPDYMDMSMANASMLDKTQLPVNNDLDPAFSSPPLPPPLEGSLIPPEPSGRCSKALQDKIAQQYERYLREGVDYNKYIQRKKDFKNPSIYEKLIQLTGIYEFGTNYAPEVYNPHLWGPASSYEELAKAQKMEMDKREEKRKDAAGRAKVEFVSGTAKKPSSSTNVTASDGESKEKKRKSKWDQGTADGSAPVVAASNSMPDVVTSSSVLTQATGTKSTVIPAVGGLLKKK